MNILVNTVATGKTGSLSVAFCFVKNIVNKQEFDNIYVIASEDFLSEEILNNKKIIFIKFSRFWLNYLIRPFLDYVYLPLLLKKISPSVIINFDNLPLKTSFSQLHVVQNSYMGESCIDLDFLSYFEKVKSCIRKSFFYRRLKYVDTVVFQTEAMKHSVIDKTHNIPNKITVIPNFVNKDKKIIQEEKQLFIKVDGYKYLLFLSYYYPHKNFDLLFSVAEEIIKNEININFVTTLPDRIFNRFMKKYPAANKSVINVGTLDNDSTSIIYNLVDGVFFPSFLESMSQVLINAIDNKLPVFVADRPYAHSLFGDNAFYFNPYDKQNAFQVVNYINDNQKVEEILSGYNELQSKILSKAQIMDLYVKEIQLLAKINKN